MARGELDKTRIALAAGIAGTVVSGAILVVLVLFTDTNPDTIGYSSTAMFWKIVTFFALLVFGCTAAALGISRYHERRRYDGNSRSSTATRPTSATPTAPTVGRDGLYRGNGSRLARSLCPPRSLSGE